MLDDAEAPKGMLASTSGSVRVAAIAPVNEPTLPAKVLLLIIFSDLSRMRFESSMISV
jgi:hypothetical protein